MSVQPFDMDEIQEAQGFKGSDGMGQRGETAYKLHASCPLGGFVVVEDFKVQVDG